MFPVTVTVLSNAMMASLLAAQYADSVFFDVGLVFRFSVRSHPDDSFVCGSTTQDSGVASHIERVAVFARDAFAVVWAYPIGGVSAKVVDQDVWYFFKDSFGFAFRVSVSEVRSALLSEADFFSEHANEF